MAQEQIQYLPLDRVSRDPDQPREDFNPEALHELAVSLKEVGQLVPIRVRLVSDRFLVVDGERRLRAAKQAGFATIAAIVESKDLCKGEVLQRQLISNCQRADLSKMELAHAIHQLMQETGWNASTIAEKLGFSNATVSKLLAILQLPETIRDQVHRGEIPLSSAYELARVENQEKQAALATQVASGMTRDALAGSVKEQKTEPADKPSSAPSRVTAKLDSKRSVTVVCESLDLGAFVQCLENALEKARRARTSGVALPTFVKMLRDQASASSLKPGPAPPIATN